jgi:hypothetical protein
MINSEEEIIKKLYDWLHLNDKLRRPKSEHVDPRHPQEPSKPVTAADYLKDFKKKEGLQGRCTRCGRVANMVLFYDEDKICYCEECVPCL